MLVEALEQHTETAKAEYAGRRRRRRRHSVEGRTDIGPYLSGAEQDRLDDLTDELGVGRSELVTALLGYARAASLTDPPSGTGLT